MNRNNRTVFLREGQWLNKRNGTTRASSAHETQAEANAEAARMLRASGGGERTTIGRNHRIVSKDTIPPGRESKVKDREH